MTVHVVVLQKCGVTPKKIRVSVKIHAYGIQHGIWVSGCHVINAVIHVQ
jgi:hypothetical protein